MTPGRATTLLLVVGLCLPTALAAQGFVAPADTGAQAPAPLTLSTALSLARSRSPSVKAADARAAAQARARDATRAWRNPTLDVSIENLGPQDLEHDGFVWLTQPLDIGARRSTRLAAAEASRVALVSEADLQRRHTDALVVRTFLGVFRGRQSMRLLAAQVAAVEDVVQLLRRRVAEGVAAEGDLRKLEAELARVRLAQLRAELDLRQQASTLGVLTGEDAALLGDRVVAPAAPPVSAPDVAAAVERRADIRAAIAHLDERRTVAAAERALGGTSVAVVGGYKRTAGFNTAAAGVTVDLPLGVRNAPARLRAEAEVAAATWELEQARSLARAEIEHALRAARLLAERSTRIDEELVQPAAVAQRAARAAFREGTGDALALIDADRVYLDTQREALAVQLDAAAAGIHARLAVGEEPLP